MSTSNANTDDFRVLYYRRKLKKNERSSDDADPTTNPSEKLNPDGVAEDDEMPHSSRYMTSQTRPHSYHAASGRQPHAMTTSNNRPHTVLMTPLDDDDEND